MLKLSEPKLNIEPNRGPIADMLPPIEHVIQKRPNTDRLYRPRTSFQPSEIQSWCLARASFKSFIVSVSPLPEELIL